MQTKRVVESQSDGQICCYALTECNRVIVGTYKYVDNLREGEIILDDTKIKTSGTFKVVSYSKHIFAANADDIARYTFQSGLKTDVKLTTPAVNTNIFVTSKHIYTIDTDGTLTISSFDLVVIRKHIISEHVCWSIVIYDSVWYVGDDSGKVHRQDGKSIKVSETAITSIKVFNAKLYMTSYSGFTYEYMINPLVQVNRYKTGNIWDISKIAIEGRCYFLSSSLQDGIKVFDENFVLAWQFKLDLCYCCFIFNGTLIGYDFYSQRKYEIEIS